MSESRYPPLWVELTPEELSLAFLCLESSESHPPLPDSLQKLSRQDWAVLALILASLMEEKSQQSVQ